MAQKEYYALFRELLELVMWLQGSRFGVTLTEIMERFGVGRRTAERMRNSVKAFFGEDFMETREGKEKRFNLKSRSLESLAVGAIQEEEIASLKMAMDVCRKNGLQELGGTLENLDDKLRILLKFSHNKKRTLEDIMKSEGLAMRPAPSFIYDTNLVQTVREAMMKCRMVKIFYRYPKVGQRWSKEAGEGAEGEALRDGQDGLVLESQGDQGGLGGQENRAEGPALAGGEGQEREARYEVIPLGILYGDRNHYLIGKFPKGEKNIRHFILNRIKWIEVLDVGFDEDQGFSLEEHCAKSFGAFQEEPFEVEWRFSPLVAPEAKNFIFHPTQKVKFNQDGSLTVKFVAGGRLEMAWHLYSWGDQVKVVKPRDFWETLPKVY